MSACPRAASPPGRSLRSAGCPVQDDLDRGLAPRVLGVLEEESAAVGGDREGPLAGRLEEGAGRRELEDRALRFDLARHHAAVLGEIEELAPVLSPARRGAAGARDLPLGAGARE